MVTTTRFCSSALIAALSLLSTGCVEVALYAKNSAASKETPGTTELHRAAFDQNVTEVTRLIAAGHSANAKNANSDTPLTYALWGSHDARPLNLSIVQLLLKAGGDANSTDSFNGGRVLHTASWKVPEASRVDLIRLLIASGAVVDAEAYPSGPTALRKAVEFQRHTAIQTLIDAGADPKKQRYVSKALQASGICDREFERVTCYGCGDSSNQVAYSIASFPERVRTLELLVNAGAPIYTVDLTEADRYCDRPDLKRGKNRLADYVRAKYASRIVSPASPSR